MARKRQPKQTEKPTVTLKELPRDAEELTNAEAEATKGGILFISPGAYKAALAAGSSPEQAASASTLIEPK
jgi:hypothetical protein